MTKRFLFPLSCLLTCSATTLAQPDSSEVVTEADDSSATEATAARGNREREPDPVQWESIQDHYTLQVGEGVTVRFKATSLYSPVRFTIDELPDGAEVTWEPTTVVRPSDSATIQYSYPVVTFTPKSGGAVAIEVTASNDQDQSSRKVNLSVEDEWESYAMPGVVYSLYVPSGSEQYGVFHGPSFELLFGAWIHRNDNRGPSHGRIYSSIGLLSSTKSGIKKGVRFDMGFDLSIERNPLRRYLIPYFGMEGNVLVQSQMPDAFYFSPFGGVHLWSDSNTFINVQYGYEFPTSHVDELRGHSVKAGIDFSLW
jgi:hypothetical protein